MKTMKISTLILHTFILKGSVERYLTLKSDKSYDINRSTV